MAIYAGADLLGRSIGLITSPIMTRLLTPAQYGAVPLLAAVWGLVALAQYGGMDWAYPFFRAQEARDKERQKILVTASFVATISVFMVWGVFSLVASVGTWLTSYAGINRLEMNLFLLGLAPLTLIGWYLYILRFLHQAWPFARINFVGRVASAVVTIPLLLVVAQESRLAVMLAVAFGVQLFATGWALWELRRIECWPYVRTLFSPDLARRMLRYGVILVPGGLVYAISAVTDRLLVGWFAGPEEVAILALALVLGSLTLMLKGWFALTWDPHSVEWVSTKDPRVYQPKLQIALLGLSAIFFPIACLSAVWSDWVVTLLYPPHYAPVMRLLPIIVLTGAYSVLSLVAAVTTRIANTPKYHLPIYTCALLINVIIGVVTIPKLGALGAVLGTLASEIFILAGWAVLGKIILRNLDFKWGVPIILAGFSMSFIAFYRPGIFLQSQGILERLLLTIIFLSGALYLIWQHRPQGGWKKALS
ncbi:MAG: oligosaccharide flippase family protein [Promethearchaeota archaeon]